MEGERGRLLLGRRGLVLPLLLKFEGEMLELWNCLNCMREIVRILLESFRGRGIGVGLRCHDVSSGRSSSRELRLRH